MKQRTIHHAAVRAQALSLTPHKGRNQTALCTHRQRAAGHVGRKRLRVACAQQTKQTIQRTPAARRRAQTATAARTRHVAAVLKQNRVQNVQQRQRTLKHTGGTTPSTQGKGLETKRPPAATQWTRQPNAQATLRPIGRRIQTQRGNRHAPSAAVQDPTRLGRRLHGRAACNDGGQTIIHSTCTQGTSLQTQQTQRDYGTRTTRTRVVVEAAPTGPNPTQRGNRAHRQPWIVHATQVQAPNPNGLRPQRCRRRFEI
mmetsp:Transcript_9245/g.56283  ORF Transcript_9245/g.56283 Transcript_9245/m.56283 type:complete len:256 (+) Transcript_9245:2037-2804(+)